MASTAACTQVLEAAVGAQDGPAGIVFGAIDKTGKILALSSAGVREFGKETAMDVDTTFPIFSCSKMIGGMAVMQLVEQGKLDLDAPVDALLPEVAAAKILSADGTLTAPTTKITLRHLLSHTSGYSYTFFSEVIKADWAAKGFSEFSGNIAGVSQSLIVEPGTEFNYGVGIDWAGVAVARTASMTLGEYCRINIFEPLGLSHTSFSAPTGADRETLASLHQRDLTTGALSVREHFPMTLGQGQGFHSAGGGAYSTVPEYLKIINVLINKGVGGNGVRILKEETVAAMFVDQVAHLKGTMDRTIHVASPELAYGPINVMPGIEKGWGLTFCLTDALPTGRSKGSAWWAGLANLYWTADPVKGVANFIASQSLPFDDPKITGTWLNCEAIVYAGI